jgi:sec-independent protein translocase protein TatA
MFGLGLPELVVIFLVVLLLFGGKALPDIAKGLGQAIRMFKREVKDVQEEIENTPAADAPSSKGGKRENLTKDTSNDFDPNLKRKDWRPKNDA